MLTILLGSDTLTKQNYINKVATEHKFELRKIKAGDPLPNLSSLNEPMLFGPIQAYIFEHFWKELGSEQLLLEYAESSIYVFIVEDTIDKRKTLNKTFLQDKRVTVKEFDSPTAATAEKWLAKHAKELDVTLDGAAANALAAALLADQHAKLPVQLAHNELLKLKSYAGGKTITAIMVKEMVHPVIGIDPFALLDAIATKNKPRALQMLGDFFEHTTGDDKAKSIQITALLADQLRNILLVLDSEQRRMPEAAVLAKTGWKSGRLFVMKKLAKNFSAQQVKQSMAKIENLDLELKSSTLPPHVILDMIICTM